MGDGWYLVRHPAISGLLARCKAQGPIEEDRANLRRYDKL
jgi:hypothetical protein